LGAASWPSMYLISDLAVNLNLISW
jgi:hypothetical protein